MSTLQIMQVILLVTIAIGISGSLLAWRERPEPGAVPLTLLLVGQCWWSATLFFRIEATGIEAKIFWLDITWPGIAVLPVAWLFFCLSYTGYSTYLQRRYIAIASVVPVLTAVLGVTNEVHHLLYTDSMLVQQSAELVIDRSPGVWFWVIAGYTYLLGFLGAIPLVQFVSSDLNTFRGQSLALLAGLFIPWATNALYLAGALPTGGIDPTPVAFSLSAVLFLGALTRFQLLGTSPAPIRPARRSVFDRMQGGLIVLDRRNNIVDMNARAAEAVGSSPTEALGTRVETAIPQFADIDGESLHSGQAVLQFAGGSQTYDISVSDLTDTHGRTAGQIITLHDISEYLRQQQRLEVLNRVFRHNVRTNTQVVLSQIDSLADQDTDGQATKAKESVLEIENFSEKIRKILDVFEQGRMDGTPVRLGIIIESCIEAVADSYPEVTIHRDASVDDIYVDVVLDDIISNVVENAAQHNTNPDPELWIDVMSSDDTVQITVRDNGPGINDEELALLEAGTETPLNHGSGLGLPLIVWGTELIGGQVRFEENDPTGAVVTLQVPVLSGSDGSA